MKEKREGVDGGREEVDSGREGVNTGRKASTLAEVERVLLIASIFLVKLEVMF